MNERIQKVFTLSFNSKIPSELKTWNILQKLPRGYGKKLFQNLMEEKFGKPNGTNFEKNMLEFLDLNDNTNQMNDSNINTNSSIKNLNSEFLKTNSKDALEM